jgi:hypothetical protein
VSNKMGLYEAGKTTTFTPSVNADWTKEFNQIAEQGKWSRNRLTEKLIIDGIRVNRGNAITINLEAIEPQQLKFLQSEQGQQIVVNLLKVMIGQTGNMVAPLLNMNNTEVASGEKKPFAGEELKGPIKLIVNRSSKSSESVENKFNNNALEKALERRKKNRDI